MNKKTLLILTILEIIINLGVYSFIYYLGYKDGITKSTELELSVKKELHKLVKNN